MRPVALLLVLLPLLLSACAGTVRIDGDISSFGPGMSGSYVALDMDGDTLHFFLLSDRAGLCGKLTSGFEQAVAAWDTLQQDPTDADQCNAYSQELADAWGPLVANQASFVHAGVAFDELTEPSGGTWNVAGEGWYQVTYFPSESPYDYVADADGGCNWSAAREDAASSIASYIANEGELELESNSSGWRVDFDVDLQDEDGDSVGSATGGFGAATCEIDVSTLAPPSVQDLWTFAPWGL